MQYKQFDHGLGVTIHSSMRDYQEIWYFQRARTFFDSINKKIKDSRSTKYKKIGRKRYRVYVPRRDTLFLKPIPAIASHIMDNVYLYHKRWLL